MSGIHVTEPFGILDDPKMPFLAQAIDPFEVQKKFEKYLPNPGVGNGRIRLKEIRVTRYKPQRRCMIEYDLEIIRKDETPISITIMGKVRAKGTDTVTYYILSQLWNSGFDSSSCDMISIPEPMGIIPEYQMLLQRKVKGDPVTRLLAGSGGIKLAEKIAKAVHKLHKVRIPISRRHTMDDELRILHQRLSEVAIIEPEFRSRLVRILESCDILAASTPSPRICGIHRDFYPDQVIVDGPRLYLIDFDMYCEGDEGLDIGNFLGHMKELGMRTRGNPNAFEALEEAMEERFIALAGEEIRISIQAYTTLTLVRHIYLSTQFPDRQCFTETLIELCERRFGWK